MNQRLKTCKNILITGGAGFIGGELIIYLLKNTSVKIFNLDKISYASNKQRIELFLKENNEISNNRYELVKGDLADESFTHSAIHYSKPDIVFHLAAESHVDRSINAPDPFIQSNIIGTYNLLKAVFSYWDKLSDKEQKNFRLHHISTDEVFGSLGQTGSFNEKSSYSPRSPYSASKAASDHLINSWHHTYGIPTLVTNCSNNFGPWQFPEKLIPKTILNALSSKPIPVYGEGTNIRDWLYVEDHIDSLIKVVSEGEIGNCYCIGGNSEKKNIEVVKNICDYLDQIKPKKSSYSELIKFVEDRPGHDFRYAINPEKINNDLNWFPKYKFEEGLYKTINWYVKNEDCYK